MALSDDLIRTGAEALTGFEYMTLGVDDFGDAVDYALDAAKALADLLYPTPSVGRTVGTTPVPIQEHSSAPYCVRVSTTSTTYDGVQAGRMLTIDRTGGDVFGPEIGADTDGIWQECPYPRGAGLAYLVTAGFARYPLEVAPAGGALRVKRWRDAIGRSAAPTSVVVDGAGLVMTITNSHFFGGSAGGGAWPASGAVGRRCVAWKNAPATVGDEAVFVGTAYSDGSAITLEIDHHFGQVTPSTTAAAYTVVVLGLTVCPPAASASVAGHWLLSTVTDGVVTAPSGSSNYALRPEDLYTLVTTADAAIDALEDRATLLESAVEGLGSMRPGVYFPGGESDYFGGLDPTVTDEGATILLTFPAWADGQWIREGGETAFGWSPSTLGAGVTGNAGRYIRFTKASTATDTYYCYVTVGAVGDEFLAGIGPLATSAPVGFGIVVFTFDYTMGAGSITAHSADLYPIRGVHPALGSGVGSVADGAEHSVGDVVMYDAARLDDLTSPARAPRAMLRSVQASAPSTYHRLLTRLSHHRQDAATDPTASADYVLDVETDWDNERRIFSLYGPGGTSQPSGSERMYLELGNSTAIEVREGATASTRAAVSIVESVANPTRRLVDLDDDGGQTSDASAAGQRWLLTLGTGVDIRMSGNGKVVGRPLFASEQAFSATWNFNKTNGQWEDGTSAGRLYVPIPSGCIDNRLANNGTGGGTDLEVLICKVEVACTHDGGGSGSLDARLIKKTTASGALASEAAISNTVSWLPGDTSEKTLSVTGSTVDGVPVGTAPGLGIFLELYSDHAGGGADCLLNAVTVYYRVFTIGA